MKPIAKKNIADSFSAQYLHYQKAASFHGECAELLVKELNALPTRNGPLLEIGSHTGILSSKLNDFCKNSKIHNIRIDLQRSGENLIIQNSNAHFLQADGEVLPFTDNTFDCIVSNATFQWFNEWENSLQNILNSLKKKGYLIFSQFLEPSLEPLKSWYRDIQREDAFIELMYEDVLKQYLQSHKDSKLKCIEKTVYFKDLKELFCFLKKMGVNAPSKNLKRLNRFQIERLKILSEKSREEKGIPLKLSAAIVVISK